MLSTSPLAFKTFLACPISQHIRDGVLSLPPAFEGFIRALHRMLREESDETFLALEREEWGAALLEAHHCAPLDFAEMRRCDLVIAYPGQSCGVAVELGWASALGKQVILLLDADSEYSPLVAGLNTLPDLVVDVVKIRVADGSPVLDDPEHLLALVRAARTRWAASRAGDTGMASAGETSAFHSHGMLGTWLIGAEEREAADAVIASRSLFRHYGPAPTYRADALEAEVAAITGARQAVAVSSGMAALRCAIQALGLRPGEEVIVPACTFVATANAVVLAGGVPVFGEIDEALGLDPALLASRITSRTRGIIAVHLQGQACRIDRIAALASDHGLWLIEDAAQAFGCSLHGQALGTFGDIGAFSLQAHKTITCGEGGLLVTNDATLAARARQYQDQGGIRAGDDYPDWDHPSAGFGENFKITELQSAVALAQCGKLDDIGARMRRIFAEIAADLAADGQVLRPDFDAAGSIPYSIILYAAEPRERDAMLDSLACAGVPADTAYAEPIYRMAPFVRWSRGERVAGLPDFALAPPSFESCPASERLLDRMIRIPLSPLYGRAERERIRAALAEAGRQAA